MSNILKILDRVRKLLALAEHTTSEHEAAGASSQAAALMETYQLSEALVRLDAPDTKPEAIVKDARLDLEVGRHVNKNGGKRKRSAYREAISQAVARDLGCKWWRIGADVRVLGRESQTQTWRYTSLYLIRQVDELCDAEWERTMRGEAGARGWKNAFRLGCAQRLAVRIRSLHAEREAVREAQRAAVLAQVDAEDTRSVEQINATRERLALVVVEKDQADVDAEYERMSAKWTSPRSIGSVSNADGRSAGNRAGDRVQLGGGRAGLAAGQARLNGGR